MERFVVRRVGDPHRAADLTADVFLAAIESASAAFSLTTDADGTLTVTIYRFEDADGLEAQLEEHGVQADVTYTPRGKRCQADRFELSPTQHQVDAEF